MVFYQQNFKHFHKGVLQGGNSNNCCVGFSWRFLHVVTEHSGSHKIAWLPEREKKKKNVHPRIDAVRAPSTAPPYFQNHIDLDGLRSQVENM